MSYRSLAEAREQALADWARLALQRGQLLVLHLNREPTRLEERYPAILVVKGNVRKCRTYRNLESGSWERVKPLIEHELFEVTAL